ncbi:discoidin domain-containing protein [Paenibacillus beijingensis]|uniref:F5/8 type C domain-containing protein n=1 Tax=Paenibacillus beijingensis TaxID=1126833 RepID=A0A0D5NMF6_9BACL|nr:discoidin domain-containing protein [Paenibacillus beijingensis]AJY76514.1 hypothetical protein VN24_20530 [Paenibacillus beijingensis]
MMKVTASSFRNPYIPCKAVNGVVSEADRWEPASGAAGPHWLQIDLRRPVLLGGTALYFWPTGSPDDAVRFVLSARSEGTWRTIPGTLYSREWSGPVRLQFKGPVTADAVRLYFLDAWLSVAQWQLLAPEAEECEPLLIDGPPLEQVHRNADYVPDVNVLVSQFGYHPEHTKTVIYRLGGQVGQGAAFADANFDVKPEAATESVSFDVERTTAAESASFDVKRAEGGETVFSGKLVTVEDDFGLFQTGDFTGLTDEGEYYIQIGCERSFRTFRIGRGLWGDYVKLTALHYFGLRRIGENSVVGDYGDTISVRWDDARTQDGKYRYIGKGFADGCDLRRFCNASLIVTQYCLLKQSGPLWDTADWIYDQVRWGLDGVLSFLGKDGMPDAALHVRTPDIHYGTDGRFESGDEGLIINAIADEEHNAFEYNGWNKEAVCSSLLLGPAEACLTFGERDPEFFERVKQLVIRGHRRIRETFSPHPHKYSLSGWAWLNALLHALTGEKEYKELAVSAAERFIGLQVTEAYGDSSVTASGWYRYAAEGEHDPWKGQTPRYGKYTDLDSGLRSPWGEKPEQEIMIVPWLYQGLFRLLDLLPDEAGAPAWKSSLHRYAREYLLALSKQNVFGLTPMKVGSKGLIRRKGTLSYQYHGEIGRMFHQLGNGALLMKAGKRFGDPELIEAAWKHAYYFTGCNPLGIGAIYGLSGNIPSQQYCSDTVGKAYPGGTVNGFNCVSSVNDYPNFQYWEYYGYANLANLWFASEIGADSFTEPLELWPRQLTEAPHSANAAHRLHTFPVRFKGGFRYRLMAVVKDGAASVERMDGKETAGERPLRRSDSGADGGSPVHWRGNGAEGGSPVQWNESRAAGRSSVQWSVNDVPGGSQQAGTISADGIYAAPRVMEELKVTIRAQSTGDSGIFAETEAIIMPVPGRTEGLICSREGNSVVLRWRAADGPVTGYTVYRRHPVTEREAGTIFERIGFTEGAGSCTFTLADEEPVGTQFIVRAYYRHGGKNYGFGEDSNTVMRVDER